MARIAHDPLEPSSPIVETNGSASSAARGQRAAGSGAEGATATTDAAGAAAAYASVRTAIVENRYRPGQRLVEQRLAEELGLSRTPVREALRMLEAEGLVVSERHRGATVRPLSSTEVVDLYGLRIRLESYATELAATRIDEEELRRLMAAADAFGQVRMQIDVQSLDGVRRLNEANRQFHDGILAAAQHDRLAAMIRRTVDVPLVFQAFRSFGPAEVERSDVFHHLIADAIRRRDAARAGALMAEHIALGRDAVLDSLAAEADAIADGTAP